MPRAAGEPRGARRAVGLVSATLLAASAGAADCRGRAGDAAPAPRSRDRSGNVLHWAAREVLLEPVAPPPGTGLTGEDLVSALEREARAWNEALAGCAVPTLRVAALRPNGAERDDGRNVVVVLASSWCPADRRPLDRCYDPTRQAVTRVRTRDDPTGPHAGEIREADVAINAVDFRWSVAGETDGTRSLRAVLGHELGHVLGLDHSCEGPTGGSSRSDPSAACDPCRSVERRASIMYPDPTESGRSAVLDPGDDVVAALCHAGPARRTTGCVPWW